MPGRRTFPPTELRDHHGAKKVPALQAYSRQQGLKNSDPNAVVATNDKNCDDHQRIQRRQREGVEKHSKNGSGRGDRKQAKAAPQTIHGTTLPNRPREHLKFGERYSFVFS
jgi:hypothetical protein